MNILNSSDETVFAHAARADLLGKGLEDYYGFAESVDRLKDALETLKSLGDENTLRRAERMLRQLDSFEPSVTMIGQIKSGKTSLVNALIGAPDLLPADVNPWTSVVTSLHLQPERDNFEESASFRFFDADEWDRLISGGGRIGELASRAGADDELEKIKRQVSEMREKSRARLGRKFEMLLGQQRDYGFIDKDLIERYVCLGEDLDDDEEGKKNVQGRFADITKSADLSMQRAGLPLRLCLRDTPGVNDTFLMREQITIRAIRDSRICVVVLSAHQALSSTDMALIRLISQVKSRDVIIFVNRMDELSNPAEQISQIRDSIAKTLERHKGPKEAEVIFGSALWAGFALQGRVDELPPSSARALQGFAARHVGSIATTSPTVPEVWDMSGLPQLQAAIADRIVNGVGAATLQRIGSSAKNLASGLAAADRIATSDAGADIAPSLDIVEARRKIDAACTHQLSALNADFIDILAAFSDRMDRVQESFLERATASLVEHLEKFGEMSPWTYDPAGLRVLLNASHKVLGRNSQAAFEKATQAAAAEFTDIYMRAFGLGPDHIGISRPRAPQVPPPVSLGRTIALDLSGSWWKRWWLQRRGYKAYAESFYDLIKSETNPMISELREDLAQAVKQEAMASFESFLSEQKSVFETLAEMHKASPAQLEAYAARHSPLERREAVNRTLDALSDYASP